jgi:hypothetical protein
VHTLLGNLVPQATLELANEIKTIAQSGLKVCMTFDELALAKIERSESRHRDEARRVLVTVAPPEARDT